MGPRIVANPGKTILGPRAPGPVGARQRVAGWRVRPPAMFLDFRARSARKPMRNIILLYTSRKLDTNGSLDRNDSFLPGFVIFAPVHPRGGFGSPSCFILASSRAGHMGKTDDRARRHR